MIDFDQLDPKRREFALFARMREQRVLRENLLLEKSIQTLSQREIEEALYDRRVKLDNLIDWKTLPRFTPENNGVFFPVSKNSLSDLQIKLEQVVKMKS